MAWTFLMLTLILKVDTQLDIDVELLNYNLAEIVSSPHLHPMINIFTHNHKGGKMILLKHPT